MMLGITEEREESIFNALSRSEDDDEIMQL